MKILYGAGKMYGSNIRLSHFLRTINLCEIKIAAHYKNNEFLENIHWNLDALETSNTHDSNKVYEVTGVRIKLDSDNFNRMLDDVVLWNPDLIISDYEMVTAYISKILSIPLVSCSPIHLVDGVVWEDGKKYLFNKQNQRMPVFAHALKRFIYSPYGILKNAPTLVSGFEWVTPYEVQEIINPRHTLNLNNFISSKGYAFNTGNSENITYHLKQNKRMCVAASPNDVESTINGYFTESLNIGISIGESENKPLFLGKKLHKLFNEVSEIQITKSHKLLNERINEL